MQKHSKTYYKKCPSNKKNIFIFYIYSIKIRSKFASMVNPLCFKLDVNNGNVCCDLEEYYMKGCLLWGVSFSLLHLILCFRVYIKKRTDKLAIHFFLIILFSFLPNEFQVIAYYLNINTFYGKYMSLYVKTSW